jgi:hypothetical protein
MAGDVPSDECNRSTGSNDNGVSFLTHRGGIGIRSAHPLLREELTLLHHVQSSQLDPSRWSQDAAYRRNARKADMEGLAR